MGPIWNIFLKKFNFSNNNNPNTSSVYFFEETVTITSILYKAGFKTAERGSKLQSGVQKNCRAGFKTAERGSKLQACTVPSARISVNQRQSVSITDSTFYRPRDLRLTAARFSGPHVFGRRLKSSSKGCSARASASFETPIHTKTVSVLQCESALVQSLQRVTVVTGLG